jgi:hypothetical protein
VIAGAFPCQRHSREFGRTGGSPLRRSRDRQAVASHPGQPARSPNGDSWLGAVAPRGARSG